MLAEEKDEGLRKANEAHLGSGPVASDRSPSKAPGEPPRKRAKTNHGDGEAEGSANRGVFEKDLPGMMYGFGDDATPRQETVELVEDIVCEYISSLLHRAMETAALRGKLKYEDFVWQVRDEPHKLERLKDLLEKNEEIKKARKMDYDKTDLLALGARAEDGPQEEGKDKKSLVKKDGGTDTKTSSRPQTPPPPPGPADTKDQSPVEATGPQSSNPSLHAGGGTQTE